MNFTLPYCTCDPPSVPERREAAEYGLAGGRNEAEQRRGGKKFGKQTIPV